MSFALGPPVIKGVGQSFGATAVGESTGTIGPKEARLVRALNKLLSVALKRGKVSVAWDSIQVNKNTVAAQHADAGVRGSSAILLLGSFKGGAFKLHGAPASTAQERSSSSRRTSSTARIPSRENASA